VSVPSVSARISAAIFDRGRSASNEVRHDHPRGCGLIVACPLAMAAALVALRTRSARGLSAGAGTTRRWSDGLSDHQVVEVRKFGHALV
jgi:hypothetical protein